MSYYRPIRKSTSLDEIKSLCIEDANGCHVWQLSLNKGYAQWRLNGKTVKLLRVVTELAYGLPESNKHALHSCDNRACLNPQHLRWGTNLENIQDRVNRNRSTTGEKSRTAKLTWDQVAVIRATYQSGVTLRELAKQYSMSHTVIQKIIANQIWVNKDYQPPIISRGAKPIIISQKGKK